jgi:uncharacterized protein YjiS (DUF1127 family)
LDRSIIESYLHPVHESREIGFRNVNAAEERTRPHRREMMLSFASRHVVSHAGETLRRVLNWPARVGAARRTMTQLARMSDYELKDIGLTRQDVADASALPLDADPSALLVHRRIARVASERPDLAA